MIVSYLKIDKHTKILKLKWFWGVYYWFEKPHSVLNDPVQEKQNHVSLTLLKIVLYLFPLTKSRKLWLLLDWNQSKVQTEAPFKTEIHSKINMWASFRKTFIFQFLEQLSVKMNLFLNLLLQIQNCTL